MKEDTIPEQGRATDAHVAAASHPLTFSITRFLAEQGRASGKEIAAALSKPRSTVGDHLRRLEVDGLIESVAEETRRGTVERFYRLTPEAYWIDDGETSSLGPAEKRRLGLGIIRAAVADASAALAANTLDRRSDYCLGSTRVLVDARGWKELAAIHRRALEEVERVRGECESRREAEPEVETMRTLSSVMLLELP